MEPGAGPEPPVLTGTAIMEAAMASSPAAAQPAPERPRRVDLRPFVISSAAGGSAMPGGLTRYARSAGEMIVNSSRGGGCKDTWVVEG